MGGITDWQRDIHEGLRRENWSLTGPTRIVKVDPGKCKNRHGSQDGRVEEPRLYHRG